MKLDHRDRAHLAFYQPPSLYGEPARVHYATQRAGVWEIEGIDTQGHFVSLALDGSAQAHVSYHDTLEGTLRYASKTRGAWAPETVDDRGLTGLHTAIVVTTEGKTHIA